MSLCRFLCPAFIWPVQPMTSHRSVMRRLMARTTTMSNFHHYTTFSMRTGSVWMTVVAGVWFDWSVMTAVGTFLRMYWIVGNSVRTMRNLTMKNKIENIFRDKEDSVLFKSFDWHKDYFHLPNPESISNLLRCSDSVLMVLQNIYPTQHTVQTVLIHTWW